jgi:hypothetical protein
MPSRNRGDTQLASEFPKKANRELFRMNREFKYGNREVHHSQPTYAFCTSVPPPSGVEMETAAIHN